MADKNIELLLNERNALLKKDRLSKKADEIEKEITDAFIADISNYPFDFVFETLTHFGHAPQLVYDDNGMFAITSSGYSPAVMGKERIEGSMVAFVKKKMWKKTIKEAMLYYLKS